MQVRFIKWWQGNAAYSIAEVDDALVPQLVADGFVSTDLDGDVDNVVSVQGELSADRQTISRLVNPNGSTYAGGGGSGGGVTQAAMDAAIATAIANDNNNDVDATELANTVAAAIAADNANDAQSILNALTSDGYVGAWQPNTAYAAGQPFHYVDANGDVAFGSYTVGQTSDATDVANDLANITDVGGGGAAVAPTRQDIAATATADINLETAPYVRITGITGSPYTLPNLVAPTLGANDILDATIEFEWAAGQVGTATVIANGESFIVPDVTKPYSLRYVADSGSITLEEPVTALETTGAVPHYKAPKRIAIISHSFHTNSTTGSAFQKMIMQSNGNLTQGFLGSVGGEDVVQMRDHIKPMMEAHAILPLEEIWFEGGSNHTDQTPDQFRKDYRETLQLLLATGIPLKVNLMAPRNVLGAITLTFRAIQVEELEAVKVPYYDLWRDSFEGATGEWKAGHTYDDVHASGLATDLAVSKGMVEFAIPTEDNFSLVPTYNERGLGGLDNPLFDSTLDEYFEADPDGSGVMTRSFTNVTGSKSVLSQFGQYPAKGGHTYGLFVDFTMVVDAVRASGVDITNDVGAKNLYLSIVNASYQAATPVGAELRLGSIGDFSDRTKVWIEFHANQNTQWTGPRIHIQASDVSVYDATISIFTAQIYDLTELGLRPYRNYIPELMETETTNATPVILTSDGLAPDYQNMVMPALESSMLFELKVLAYDTGDNSTKVWKIDGAIRKELTNASVAFLGTPSSVVVGQSGTAATWDANLTLNTTLGGIDLNVTGAAGRTIRWKAVWNVTELNGR